MVVRAEQERIRALLKDTITLLCKNGLAYNMEFSLEALIGITLDKDEVLLVSINETVKSAAAKESEELESNSRSLSNTNKENQSNEHGTEVPSSNDRVHSSARKRRKSSDLRDRRESSDSEGSNSIRGESPADHSTAGDHRNFLVKAEGGAPMKRLKTEEYDEEADEDFEDTIIIKEELPDEWAEQSEISDTFVGDSFSNLAQRMGDQDLSQALQSGSVSENMPSGFGEQYSPRTFSQGRVGPGGFQGQQRGATVGAAGRQLLPPQRGIDPRLAHTQQQPYPNTPKGPKYNCTECKRLFSSRSGRDDHMRQHKGLFRYTCVVCSKGFMNKTHYQGHMNHHENRRPFTCVHCGEGFCYRSGAMNHQKLCAPPGERDVTKRKDGSIGNDKPSATRRPRWTPHPSARTPTTVTPEPHTTVTPEPPTTAPPPLAMPSESSTMPSNSSTMPLDQEEELSE